VYQNQAGTAQSAVAACAINFPSVVTLGIAYVGGGTSPLGIPGQYGHCVCFYVSFSIFMQRFAICNA